MNLASCDADVSSTSSAGRSDRTTKGTTDMAVHRFRSRIHSSGRIAVAAVVASAACAVGLTAGPTSAGALLLPSCPERPIEQEFRQWGDPSWYFLMPDGGFEAGAQGWALSNGAAVSDGNEPFFANDPNDEHSLVLPTGGRAVSPTVCVAMGENTIRLFVQDPGVDGAVLHVRASVRNPLTGLVLSTRIDLVSLDEGWSPTTPILIPNLLGGIAGTQRLTLTFSTSGADAAWSIDDVYVDPIRSR
jgi:hypothetical protein